MRRAFLGLGSNLGDREGNLREAIARLGSAEGVNVLRRSRVYRTEPIGVTDQPEFLNMVVEVELPANINARDLLTLVKRIEREMGRSQTERWGPREIDIDLLLFGDEKIKDTDFEVPHPRMWERAFVMAPLADLEPDMKTPIGEMVREVAERLGREQGVRANLHL